MQMSKMGRLTLSIAFIVTVAIQTLAEWRCAVGERLPPPDNGWRPLWAPFWIGLAALSACGGTAFSSKDAPAQGGHSGSGGGGFAGSAGRAGASTQLGGAGTRTQGGSQATEWSP